MDRPVKPLNGLLKMAVLAGVETAVKLHIRRGDDLDARDGSGTTPLMLAAGRGKKGVLALLLDAGADPTLVDPEGRDALTYARKSGSAECEAIVLSALSENARFDESEGSLPKGEGVAQENLAVAMNDDMPSDETCWTHEECVAPHEAESDLSERQSLESESEPVAATFAEQTIPPVFVNERVEQNQVWSHALSLPDDSNDDFSSDFWEAEAEAVAPVGNMLIADEVRGLHEAIGRHKAIDDSEDWSDVEIFLPERAAPIISDSESEPLRRLLLRALSEGSVPAANVAIACANADGSVNLESEQLLRFVLGDIGSDIDERDESGEDPWCLPVSEANEDSLSESLDHLMDLFSGRNEPARYYVRAFRGKLLGADEEISLAKEMEESGEDALSALARWPGGLSIVLDYADKLIVGGEGEKACFDSMEQDESPAELSEEGDESVNGNGAETGTLGRFAVLAAEIRKAGGNCEAVEARLREVGFSRHFLAELADSCEGNEVALSYRSAILRQVAARDRMVLSNLRLSFSIAKKYMYSGEPLDDLVQEGNIGLMKAVEKYDWRKGFRFSTYATWWIRQQITRHIADHQRTIRLPVHMHEKLLKALRERNELAAANHRPESLSEMAAKLGMAEGRLASLLAVFEDTLSLDESESEEGLPLIDGLPGPAEDDPSVKADAASLSAILKEMLSEFDERSAEVITLRFGLSGEDSMTLEEVGQHFGVTRERIRQVESKGLKKLSHPSRLDQLAYFVPGHEPSGVTRERVRQVESQSLREAASSESSSLRAASEEMFLNLSKHPGADKSVSIHIPVVSEAEWSPDPALLPKQSESHSRTTPVSAKSSSLAGRDNSKPEPKSSEGKILSSERNKQWKATTQHYLMPASFLEATERLRIDSVLDKARSLGFEVRDERSEGGKAFVTLPESRGLNARELQIVLAEAGFERHSFDTYCK